MFIYSDDFADAVHEKERRRHQLPPVYNNARLMEMPLPVLVLPGQESIPPSETSAEDLDPLAEDVSITTENETQHQPNVNISLQTTSNQDGPIDTARAPHVPIQNVTDNQLSVALQSVLNMVPTKIEPVFEQMNYDDTEAAEEVFNDSYENYGSSDEIMIHRTDAAPKPIVHENPYQVKTNDMVSGNMPFALNAAGDRSYILSQGSVWKPVTLTNRIVKGLIAFNTGSFRDSIRYDEKFIKVLIVACIGIDGIRAQENDPIKIDFIKGMITISSLN